MLHPGGNQVDPGGVDGAVAQHVRQPGHVPGGPVEAPGEEMAQVVGKDLGGLHPGLTAKGFQFTPYLPP